MRWPRQLRSLFRRRRAETDLEDELAFHIAMQAEANAQAGMPGGEAREAARRQFGGVTQQREACRDHIFGGLDGLARDLKYAVRTLTRSPGFTATVLVTLALGIGASTAVFCAMDRLLLSAVPYPDPDRLVALHETQTGKGYRPISVLNFLDWKAENTVFEHMAIYATRTFGLRGGRGDGGAAVSVINIGMATADLFAALGRGPVLGRPFSEREEIAHAQVIVLSDGLWARQFNRDRGVLGRTVQVNEVPYTVIGILPADFVHPTAGKPVDAYVPLNRDAFVRRESRPAEGVARLKDGVPVETAHAQLRAIGARLARMYPDANPRCGADFEPIDEAWKGNLRRPLLLLSAAALLLLAIVCTNVINLMLARALARGREFAIRRALGAGFAGLLRQTCAEALLVSAAGGLAGMLLAHAVLRGLPTVLSLAGATQPLAPIAIDRSALLFAAALCVFVTFLCGVAPAIFARSADVNTAIKDGGLGSARRGTWRVRVRQGLVVGQVALSLMLLLSAGLFLRVFLKLASRDPGFDSAQIRTFGIGLPEIRYTELQMIGFHHKLRENLAAIPGVETAGLANWFPLDGRNRTTAFQFEGAGLRYTEWPWVAWNIVDPEYFTAMRIPLLAGRNFSREGDRSGHPLALLVNRTFARMYGANGGVIGKRVQMRFRSDLVKEREPWEIVGVVGDTYQMGLDARLRPQVYMPASQIGLDGAGYLIRTARTDAGLVKEVAGAVRQIDPNLERITLKSLETHVSGSLGHRRTPAILTGLFAAIGLLLTALGLYGVVALEIGQRRREIAIRVAIGAGRGSVVRLALARGLLLVAVGGAVGMLVFRAGGKALESQLYEVAPSDPLTAGAVVAVLLLFAVLACLRPAWEALRVDPVSVLREM